MSPFSVDICIIAEDAAEREVLARLLNPTFSVIEAPCAVSGVRCIRDYRPRVVICDMELDGTTGVQLCREVRSDASISGMYFILIASPEQSDDKHDALKSGADDFLIRPYDFDELSARLSNGVRISRLLERLHYAALTDGLTGLWNHTHFRHLLDMEFARARRYGGAVSLIMLDLDHFKAINDTYGHEVGNHVLRLTSQHIQKQVRETDVIARYGGEEFAIICPRTELEEALKLAERIRQKFPNQVRVPNHPETVVTASFGVMSSQDPTVNNVSDLINIGDQALYESKRRGRNQVATYRDIAGTTDNLIDNEELERLNKQVASLSMQAKELCLQSIWALVQALEARDRYTAQHSQNTAFYAECMGKAAGWSGGMLKVLCNAALLHDLGKIGIPDDVLQKSGTLSPREAGAVLRVPQITCRILEPLRIFESEITVIRHLRERFDGTGTPARLTGDHIPVATRLLAVAEAFDAMTSDRQHRPRYAFDDALQRIDDESGQQFDPEFAKLIRSCAAANREQWENVIRYTHEQIDADQEAIAAAACE